MNRPSLGKTVFPWAEADVWERLHMDWGYVKDQDSILVIVDAGSGWTRISKTRISETGLEYQKLLKVYLSQTFARFGIPKCLVSDNDPEFVSGDLKQWCESLGMKRMESPFYQTRANGLAERAVPAVERALKAWSPSLMCHWRSPAKTLMTHRNT